VLATTGTVVSDKVGNVTGWAGRAWNFADVLEIVFGYSFAAPVIQEVAGVDWYNWDFTAGGQVSKVMGNDLMGGADGGGWFLSWRAPATEFPDTDDNPYTDPAGALNGPFVNGVTSARRCLINCQRPPTTTSGIFWEEASSPPFRSGATGEDWESEDIFATGACLAHPNNDP